MRILTGYCLGLHESLHSTPLFAGDLIRRENGRPASEERERSWVKKIEGTGARDRDRVEEREIYRIC